jgi:hypothetical protein
MRDVRRAVERISSSMYVCNVNTSQLSTLVSEVGKVLIITYVSGVYSILEGFLGRLSGTQSWA